LTVLDLATTAAVVDAAEAAVSSPPPIGNHEAKGMIILASPHEQ
jgi:hypothetical protein